MSIIPRREQHQNEETAIPPEGPPAGTLSLRPPRGFASELYPLRHRILNAFALSAVTSTQNSAFITLVRSSQDSAVVSPKLINVNPHNTFYQKETGPLVQKMSIIDKLTLSLKFSMTDNCYLSQHISGQSTSEVFSGGDKLPHIHLTWRPIFFSFREKLDASDDDTGTTVATILGLTADDTNQDVVPLTTNNLSTAGSSDLLQAMSSVNDVEISSDYNMTVDTIYEDHPWDEDLFQEAIMRFTNKGALKACVGRTRHVHLTHQKPFVNYYIRKFVPRAIRRVMDFTFMGIQINVPLSVEFGSDYHITTLQAGAHIGVKALCQYHEWNADHNQEMTGDAS